MGEWRYFALGAKKTRKDFLIGKSMSARGNPLLSETIYCGSYDVCNLRIYRVEVDEDGYAAAPFFRVERRSNDKFIERRLSPGGWEFNHVLKWVGHVEDSPHRSAPHRAMFRQGNSNLILSEEKVRELLMYNGL